MQSIRMFSHIIQQASLVLGVLLLSACRPDMLPDPLDWVRPADGAQSQSQPGEAQVSTRDISVPLVAPMAQSTPSATALPPEADPPLPAPTIAATLAAPPPTEPPAPTPLPILRQLTTGGCCVNPMWAADSRSIRFIDRPSPEMPTGIYTLPIAPEGPPLAAGALLTTRIVDMSPDDRYAAWIEGGVTWIEDQERGTQWQLDTNGQRVAFSPNSIQVLWQMRDPNPATPFDRRQTQVWVANIDGTSARPVISLLGGGVSGWLPDGRLLLTRRLGPQTNERALELFDPQTGASTALFQAERMGSVALSPGGQWALLMINMETKRPELNGFWLVPIDGSPARQISMMGAYRWRDAQRLLLIPMELGAPSHRLWQLDAATGALTFLTDPAFTSFRVANNDWTVAPDGQSIVFVSAHDYNLYLLPLAP